MRPPSPENADAIQEALEESFSELHVWMDWAMTLQSLETTEAVLARARADYEAMEDFAVHAFLKDTGQFVLSAGLHPLNWDVPKFEIGYWCRTSMQGKGYVTEVVRELTTAAFRDLAAKRVEIRCDSRNHNSRRVAERAGFRLEAELRWDDRANDGSLRDTIVYVLLAEDLHSDPDLVYLSGKGNRLLSDERRVQGARHYWDDSAASFDDEPDHGLRDPLIREAWTSFLRESLPYTKATVLDIGCGTGSLSVVLAELGHEVTGIDLSPSMISLARTKAAASGFHITFHVMDAAAPSLSGQQFDAIVCRHLLWTLPEPKDVLQRWAQLLKPKGRLMLIEGYWGTGAGLRARQILDVLPASFLNVLVQTLSDHPNLWGKEVHDERYAILADRNR